MTSMVGFEQHNPQQSLACWHPTELNQSKRAKELVERRRKKGGKKSSLIESLALLCHPLKAKNRSLSIYMISDHVWRVFRIFW